MTFAQPTNSHQKKTQEWTQEQLRSVLFKDIQTVRINEGFTQPEMATHLLESNLEKLNLLYQRGSESFGAHEAALKALFA